METIIYYRWDCPDRKNILESERGIYIYKEKSSWSRAPCLVQACMMSLLRPPNTVLTAWSYELESAFNCVFLSQQISIIQNQSASEQSLITLWLCSYIRASTSSCRSRADITLAVCIYSTVPLASGDAIGARTYEEPEN
jgi:hypothetical protein